MDVVDVVDVVGLGIECLMAEHVVYKYPNAQMLKMAGVPVAMGNAPAHIQAMAKCVGLVICVCELMRCVGDRSVALGSNLCWFEINSPHNRDHRHVAPTNDEHGAAHAFERLVLGL